MIKKLLITLIRLYQKYFSYKTCAYTPTCSEYMIEAILKRGIIVGIALGIWRILRCNPWTKGGFDKVPDKKNIVKWVY